MLIRTTLALGAIALLALTAASYGDNHTISAVAHFREVDRAYSNLGDFAGSSSVWRTTVLLHDRNQAIGNGIVACTQIEQLSPLRQCTASYYLPEGKIFLSGRIYNRLHFTLDITGATGVYEGRDGVAAFATIGLAPHTQSITIYLSPQ